MNKKILPLLVCPVCKGELEFKTRENELICHQDKLAYPVRNGIPILLASDARKLAVAE